MGPSVVEGDVMISIVEVFLSGQAVGGGQVGQLQRAGGSSEGQIGQESA